MLAWMQRRWNPWLRFLGVGRMPRNGWEVALVAGFLLAIAVALVLGFWLGFGVFAR